MDTRFMGLFFRSGAGYGPIYGSNGMSDGLNSQSG